MWPLVLGALHFFLFLYYLLYIFAAMLPYPRVKTVKKAMDGFYCLFPFQFYVAWLVWGNIIVYYMARPCRFVTGAGTVYRLVFAWIIMGYLLWAIYLCGACLLACNFMRRFIQRKARERALSLFSIFGDDYDYNRKYMKAPDRCSICGEKYLGNDELIQLRCGDQHVFHSQCLVRYVERDPSCPMCRARIEDARVMV